MYNDFYEKIKTRIENEVFIDSGIINEVLESFINYIFKLNKKQEFNFEEFIDTYLECLKYYIQRNNIDADDKRIAIIFQKGFNFWYIVSEIEEGGIVVNRNIVKQSLVKLYRWFIDNYPKFVYVIPMNKIGHDIITDIVKENPIIVKYFMKSITSIEYKKRYVLFYLKINRDTYKYLGDYINELGLDDHDVVIDAKEVSLAREIQDFIN